VYCKGCVHHEEAQAELLDVPRYSDLLEDQTNEDEDEHASGKTSNVNLELFQMIFNNPGNGTDF
jgi:hypothetical protein